MESRVSVDSEACTHPDNLVLRNGDSVVSTSSSQEKATPQQPAKKQTRQWAAWTRQEEESFFNALRQVGKNFEKITCRVQSKNKDQVRHYYYRLVRRMNKLLGPELCLDAKNSKDTNAAMLRWWSLLEKYSCKASKLHLKPRRFKIFVETLENQLLKDRKKSIRKRHSHGENSFATVPTAVSSQGRMLSDEDHMVNMVLIDSQNIQKSGSGKGSSLKRNMSIGINRNNCKADSSSTRAARHRRKTGLVSVAAYKRWEKAAIAGVSLVADAAEHLERSVTGHIHTQNNFDDMGKDDYSLPVSTPILFNEKNVQSLGKLKLQLFPFDDHTRRALEMDNRNPHLELTLSTRKKISSVLEHLNRKWGDLSIASGELLLFPYWVEREKLVGCLKWSKDSTLSAGDVYSQVGGPQVFRLRYGWFSTSDLANATSKASLSPMTLHGDMTTAVNQDTIEEQNPDIVPTFCEPIGSGPEKQMGACESQLVSSTVTTSLRSPSTVFQREIIDHKTRVSECSDHASTLRLERRECGEIVSRQVENTDEFCSHKPPVLSAGEWADTLTNISVGDLLAEVSHNIDTNCKDPLVPGSPHSIQQIPFSCDSFDAAIAAHIHKHESKVGFQPRLASSIWDAEETRDAFTYQKNDLYVGEVQSARRDASPELIRQRRLSISDTAIEDLPETKGPVDDVPPHEDPTVEQPDYTLDHAAKDLSGLTDIYWPDSLGPLDLDIPSCRYHSNDLILSDSLSGLNRLIASSLDAFQNCSFFGSDKKEQASAAGAQESSSFSDYKIGSEV